MAIYRPNVGETLNMARIVITTSMIRLHFSNFGLHFWMMMVPIKHGIIAEQAQSMNQNGWNITSKVTLPYFPTKFIRILTKRKHVSTMQVAAIATFAQSNILSFFSISETFKI